ncbi:MAG: hypothetical protein EBW88_04100, partial [Betaproteobacteria bacterium]|nr:hypothetical protein [Betaproteobacteria bacterium]
LDITASSDGRETMVDVVRRVAEQVFIPFTVGGGIRSVEDAQGPRAHACCPSLRRQDPDHRRAFIAGQPRIPSSLSGQTQ